MHTYSKLTYYFEKVQFNYQNLSNRLTQWFFLCLIGFGLLLLCSCSSGQTNYPNSSPITLSPKHIDTQFMQLTLKGSIVFKSTTFNGIPIQELSGITWDNDEKILYAVSDEGYFYHLKLSINNNQLDGLNVVYASKLSDRTGKPLKGKYRDAEGLSALNANNGKRGDTQLLIAFENKPRIELFSTQGKKILAIKTPKKLSKKSKFRHKNKALESVSYHPKYGIITAAEYPIKKYKKTTQTLFSNTGKEWHFERSKATNSAITGLEVLANGDVLVLERAYKNPVTPVVINLRRLHLDQCTKDKQCKTETIARFNASDGWVVDNFEGLAHYKGNQYLMVSDDNNNIFQKTILVLFEISNNKVATKKKENHKIDKKIKRTPSHTNNSSL